MGAYAELRETGSPGPLTLAMLLRLGRQIGRTATFPPPGDYHRWTDAGAVEDLIGEMFVAKPHMVAGCLINAHDDGSLERLLLAAIKNWLVDQARGTEVGKLRRRLVNVLGEDSRFVAVKAGHDRWALTGNAATVWQGDLVQLHAAAYRVRGVRISRWNKAGPTPREIKEGLTAIASEVLTEAGGSVSAQDLSAVLAARLDLHPSPTFVELSANTWPEAGRFVDPATTAVADTAADQLWISLTPDEQAVIPLLAADPGEVAAQLRIGRDAAAAVQAGIQEKLRLATVDDEEAGAFISSLLSRAQRADHVMSSEQGKGAQAHTIGQDAVS